MAFRRFNALKNSWLVSLYSLSNKFGFATKTYFPDCKLQIKLKKCARSKRLARFR
jgi:hypothetical protein